LLSTDQGLPSEPREHDEALPDISTDQGLPSEPREHDEDESVCSDDMAIDYVPPKNRATIDLMAQRKFMDLKKWCVLQRSFSGGEPPHLHLYSRTLQSQIEWNPM
jgi:hypothetical protein